MLRSFLGRGKDVTRSFGEYNALRLASFWKIQHPRAQRRYDVAKKDIIMTLLDRKGVHALGTLSRGLPVACMPSKPATGTRGASEAFCLHGTSAPMLLSLLKNGLNERYSGSNSGTAFGDGIYLAEDVAKSDQYSAPDVGYDKSCDLHRRLYGKSYRHKGSIFYVLVCRVLLGYPARTLESGKGSTQHGDGRAPLPAHFP